MWTREQNHQNNLRRHIVCSLGFDFNTGLGRVACSPQYPSLISRTRRCLPASSVASSSSVWIAQIIQNGLSAHTSLLGDLSERQTHGPVASYLPPLNTGKMNSSRHQIYSILVNNISACKVACWSLDYYEICRKPRFTNIFSENSIPQLS